MTPLAPGKKKKKVPIDNPPCFPKVSHIESQTNVTFMQGKNMLLVLPVNPSKKDIAEAKKRDLAYPKEFAKRLRINKALAKKVSKEVLELRKLGKTDWFNQPKPRATKRRRTLA